MNTIHFTLVLLAIFTYLTYFCITLYLFPSPVLLTTFLFITSYHITLAPLSFSIHLLLCIHPIQHLSPHLIHLYSCISVSRNAHSARPHYFYLTSLSFFSHCKISWYYNDNQLVVTLNYYIGDLDVSRAISLYLSLHA